MSLEGVENVLRLSHAQSGMLFHSAVAPQSGVYVTHVRALLDGSLDVAAFKRAWDGAIERHPPLRAGFVWDGVDEPLQVIRREVHLEWTELDWRDRTEASRASALEGLLEEDLRRGFDLAVAPLMRMLLIRVGDRAHRWVWTCHHILADGWSAAVVLREVLDRYRAICDGEPRDLPPSTAFEEYIAWLHSRPIGPDEEFWTSYLAGFESRTSAQPRSAALGPVAPVTPPLHRVLERRLSEEDSRGLRRCCREFRVTLNTLAQGAWSILLHRYSGERDVVSGATVAGRPPRIAGVEDAVGSFINTLPVRVLVDNEQPLRRWLAEVQEVLLRVREHEQTSLAGIQRWSAMPPGEPLFDNLLVLENTPDGSADLEVPGLRVRDLRVFGPSNYPLAMVITPGQEIALLLEYDPATHSEESASRILEHFQNLLTAMPSGLERPVGALPLLSEGESRRLLLDWNDSGTVTPEADTVLELIRRCAEELPARVAVACGNEELSYRDLERRSDQWARRLVARGVVPGDFVGICMERGVSVITGILAILKAGGAYLPLDPEYPRERLRSTMYDSGAKIVLTTTDLADALRLGVEPECADAPSPTDDRVTLPAVTGSLHAYVIHTSGSTGEPKGVPVTHRNLLHSTLARVAYYEEPPSVFLLLSSLAFDSSVAGIFWSLAQGATLVVSEPRIEQDMMRLARCIAERAVSHTLCLPSLYRLLLEHGDVADLQSLRTVIAAGEALPPGLVRHHRKAVPQARLFNEYGPTEATVWCCVFDTASHDGEGAVPIGRPIAGMRLYLLDGEGRPVPVGVPGEIYVAGDGLTAGYLNRPEATAERFVERVIGGERIRAYRTGDLGRHRPDGNIEFLGRLDRQLKIRGFRVEPAEVEAALRRHEAVGEAVVMSVSADDEEAGGRASLIELLGSVEPEDAEEILTMIEALTDEEARQLSTQETLSGSGP